MPVPEPTVPRGPAGRLVPVVRSERMVPIRFVNPNHSFIESLVETAFAGAAPAVRRRDV